MLMALGWHDKRTVLMLSTWHNADVKTISRVIRGEQQEDVEKPQQRLYGMQQTTVQESNPFLLRDVCQKTWIAPRCILPSIPHPQKLQTIKLLTAPYLCFHFPCFLTCVLPSFVLSPVYIVLRIQLQNKKCN